MRNRGIYRDGGQAPRRPRSGSPPYRRRYQEVDRQNNNGADRGYGQSDSYRPAPPPPPARNDHYSNYQSDDRDSHVASRPPPPPFPPPSYPPAPGAPGSYGDSYRPGFQPRVPQGDFTFSAPAPPGVNFNAPPPAGPRGSNRGRRNDYANNSRRNRRVVVATSERPILTANGKDGPQVQLRGDDEGVTYRNIDHLSDTDEHSMSISDESVDQSGEPTTKRRRTEGPDSKGSDQAPVKWSNPEQFDALAPEVISDRKSTGKRVLELIRKARIEEAAKASGETAPQVEETIAFDAESDSEASTSNTSLRDAGPLGSRKRTASDRIKTAAPTRQGGRNKMPGRSDSLLSILPEWKSHKAGQAACPWLDKGYSASADMMTWLHKEMLDFYDFVRPRKFEHEVRSNLVETLQSTLHRYPPSNHFKKCEVRAFGSFMSGLYLPTADMDLVICSGQLLDGGAEDSRMKARTVLWKLRHFLQQHRICKAGTEPQVIIGAKVPIVKYIDAATGLNVDVSFENISGITAIQTFLDWKTRYPCMPILVTIIKQFLAMRDFNEPVKGGIGSFTVICLVVSMLQLSPQMQTGSFDANGYLGEMLVEFFRLYGSAFHFEDLAICLDPPAYIPKDDITAFPYKNMDRLSIIDPNNSANDISGGSRNFMFISEDFISAFHVLRDHIDDVCQLPRHKRAKMSLLEPIVGGNYSSFADQRNHLRTFHRKRNGRRCDESFTDA